MSSLAAFIRFDPILVPLFPLLAFLGFVVAAPVLLVTALILALRDRSRHVGLLMLRSGAVGFFCMAAAATFRTGSKAHQLPSIEALVAFGLAGFTAFVTVAMLFHWRSRQRPNQSLEPTAGRRDAHI
jgi:hypothetical protein